MCEIVPSSPVKSASLCGNRCGNSQEYKPLLDSVGFNISISYNPALEFLVSNTQGSVSNKA